MNSILYLSNTCSENEYLNLYQGADKFVAQQGCKFNRLFAEGFAQNNCNVTLVSGRPINQQLLKKKFYNSKNETVSGVNYQYLPFVNVRYVRQLMIFLNARNEIKKWLSTNPEGTVICDVLNYSLFKAVSSFRKHYPFKLIGIVTDLPEMLANGKPDKRSLTQNEMISDCDGLILLAKAMNDKINPNFKPYIVMEGFSDIKMSSAVNSITNKYDKKVILYAGLLHKKYGIENLTRAFIGANIKDSELHIYGTGDYENELRQICLNHSNVKYFGTKDNSFVVNEQLKATLLVNPRPTDEEFVKYSFPSKNMEYIVSGTPMLTTDLPSMPSEYKDYCFVANGFDVESLKDALSEILSIPKEILHERGLAAKEWALQNKNNRIQSKKVLEFNNRI